jgi:hypothetical protein
MEVQGAQAQDPPKKRLDQAREFDEDTTATGYTTYPVTADPITLRTTCLKPLTSNFHWTILWPSSVRTWYA